MRKARPRVDRDDSREREPERAPRTSDAVLLRPQNEPSAAHARVPEAVPAAWLDRLLAAVVDLPLATGERAVVAALVDAVAAILPDYAIGACFVPAPGSTMHGQVVLQRLPEGFIASPAGID